MTYKNEEARVNRLGLFFGLRTSALCRLIFNVAELVKSFERHRKSPKVLTIRRGGTYSFRYRGNLILGHNAVLANLQNKHGIFAFLVNRQRIGNVVVEIEYVDQFQSRDFFDQSFKLRPSVSAKFQFVDDA